MVLEWIFGLVFKQDWKWNQQINCIIMLCASATSSLHFPKKKKKLIPVQYKCINLKLHLLQWCDSSRCLAFLLPRFHNIIQPDENLMWSNTGKLANCIRGQEEPWAELPLSSPCLHFSLHPEEPMSTLSDTPASSWHLQRLYNALPLSLPPFLYRLALALNATQPKHPGELSGLSWSNLPVTSSEPWPLSYDYALQNTGRSFFHMQQCTGPHSSSHSICLLHNSYKSC